MRADDPRFRRLQARGTLTITIDADHESVPCPDKPGWYTDRVHPVWDVHLARKFDPRSRLRGWFYTMVGWHDIHVRGVDLDRVLDRAIEDSEPPNVDLRERVWEHLDFIRLCEAEAS